MDWTGVGLVKSYGGGDRQVRTAGLSGGRMDAKESSSRVVEDDNVFSF